MHDRGRLSGRYSDFRILFKIAEHPNYFHCPTSWSSATSSAVRPEYCVHNRGYIGLIQYLGSWIIPKENKYWLHSRKSVENSHSLAIISTSYSEKTEQKMSNVARGACTHAVCRDSHSKQLIQTSPSSGKNLGNPYLDSLSVE